MAEGASSSSRGGTATAELARFCTAMRWAALPEAVRERTKELVLDHLGVAVRGSREESSRRVAAFVRGMGSPGEATAIGGGFRSAASWAALANGTAAHAVEMDDVTTESSLHPGVAVIPAALAVAEERAAAPSAFLEAVIAGYEVTMRVGNALNPASAYRRGFHPTGVAGVFGAAMAAGRLLGLEAEALTQALGIAGTMAAGSLEYLADGSWTKRLNAGWAAHAGIAAAGLAAAGFTGPATALEGRLGLLHAYSDDAIEDRLLAALGEPPQVMRVSIKPYACCRYNHGLIDCVLALRKERGIRPEEVTSVSLGVLSGGALLVAEPIAQKRAPKNVVDAQFSAPFAAAVALARGGAGTAEYTTENLENAEVRALMARTDCYRDPTLDAVYPARWPAEVKIELRNGETVVKRVEYATGEPENPVPRATLIAKFAGLAESIVPGGEAGDLARRVLAWDEERDVRGLTALLMGRGPGTQSGESALDPSAHL